MPAELTISSAHQQHLRERLLLGMVEVAADKGYRRASVARVIDRAGTSRRTFYSHFSGREDCFAAAYEMIVAKALAVAARAAGAATPAERPRAMLECLLKGVAANPTAARIALLEVHAAPPTVRACHERLIRDVERNIAHLFEGVGAAGRALEIPVAALRAGIEDVVSIRLLRGEASSLPTLTEDLLAWVETYRLPFGATRLPQSEWIRLSRQLPCHPQKIQSRASLLPRGRSALPALEAANQRYARILRGMIEVTAGHGYSSVTVAQIAAAARVTKAAFYSHFRSKQEAFLAAQRLGLQESLAAAASAFYAETGWLDRVWAGLRALLRYLAENPDLALLGAREVYAVGEEAITLEHDIRNAFTLFLGEGQRNRRSTGRALPTIASEAIAGANHGLVRRKILCAGPEYAPRLLPQLTYVTVVPFVGHGVATSFIEKRVEAVSRGERPAVRVLPGFAASS